MVTPARHHDDVADHRLGVLGDVDFRHRLGIGVLQVGAQAVQQVGSRGGRIAADQLQDFALMHQPFADDLDGDLAAAVAAGADDADIHLDPPLL